jgi:hypothetical protein
VLRLGRREGDEGGHRIHPPVRPQGDDPARATGLIFRFLAEVRLSWREVLFGSTVTAVLFKAGQYVQLPDRITLTAREKAHLIKFGAAVGSAIRHLVTIVSYRTFCRWTAAVAGPPLAKQRAAPECKPGRPRTAQEIRELIVQIAGDNGWGYTRVLGEVKKLGIHNVSRSTVVNILKEAGIDPGPKRGEGSWDEFVKRHAATLWACDFLSVRSVTMGGIVELYLLFFVHVGSRRAVVSSPTANPDAAWVAQQARNASMQMQDWGSRPAG